MANDNFVSVTGNATRDAELRFTAGGWAVTNFGLAYNRKWRNAAGEDQEKVSFFDVTCWGTLAENVAETIEKGMRVTVSGRLDQDTYETKEGEKRSKVEIIADAVSPDLRWAAAVVTKNQRNSEREPDFNTGGRGGSRGGGQRAPAPAGPGPGEDEEPFVMPAGEWWPEADIGPAWPERMLP